MSIQAAGGTYVNATSSTLAARSDMQAFVRDNLITAGWSVISGGGTGDTLLQSASTPAGFHCQLRCFDPGSGNCAQFTMRNVSGSRISSIGYMLPTSGRQFRIVANKYQFFVFATGGTEAAVAREVMMGGVPYLPSNVAGLTSNLDCFWFIFTGDSDTTTTARTWQPRYRLRITGSGDAPAAATLFNDVLVNYTSGLVSAKIPALVSIFVALSTNTSTPLDWADSSFSLIDSVLAWSANSSATGTPVMYGQIWDSAIVIDNGILTAESTVSISGNNYLILTFESGFNNAQPAGRLVVRVP